MTHTDLTFITNEEKKAKLTGELYKQFEESHRLETAIRKNLEMLGYGE